ncbi:TatD DNase family protein [Litorivivens lipolytica]|uniref:TatD DNase family protein n=1 Tax=Litorivivens lipolytica TaxID=1524264 RepID=A0A7W4Z4I2_9GAMM|nr:TatD family hydrolase [Litorivivens lipolytica]MBB3046534.1 TatD DNase family protein [Litorivivens lipolytica]
MLIDSHCHLDRLDLSPYDGNLDAALQAARERGVQRMLCIGIDRGNAQTVVDIASKHEDIYASVGIHPLDLADDIEATDALIELADHQRVIAIGETGLDYYYSEDNKAAQQDSFRNHLRAAAKIRKPLIVHTRNARQDTLDIIREESDPDVAGVLHCFTESREMAHAALDMNFYISFSGIITFKNAADLREVVASVPLDRMLVETDSPYLAPVPFRGKKNEPKYVVEVAQCVADIKGISFEEVVAQTAENFNRLFKLAA